MDADSTPFEKVREKLEKLRAARDCAASTPGEKESAQARIDALLEKHGLTEETASSTHVSIHLFKLEKARWARRLFMQCASWLLQNNTLHTVRAPRGFFALMATPLDAADIRACYAYYTQVIRTRESEIRDQVRDVKAEMATILKSLEEQKKGLCEALLYKYELFGPQAEQPGNHKKISEAEFKAWLRRRQIEEGFTADKWERGEKLDDSNTLLLL
jgi:hypothetical protein